MIIPISSFALCAEYAHQENGINNVARYIIEKLGPRRPGGLKWESWLHNPVNVPLCEGLRKFATMVAFAITPLGALAWAFPDVFWSGYKLSSGGEDSPNVVVAGGVQAAIITTWIIGLVASLSNIWIILRVSKLKDPKAVAASIRRSIDVGHKGPRWGHKGSRWVRSHSLCSSFGFHVWTPKRMVKVARLLESCEIEMKPPIGEARLRGERSPHAWIVLSTRNPGREGPPPEPGVLFKCATNAEGSRRRRSL